MDVNQTILDLSPYLFLNLTLAQNKSLQIHDKSLQIHDKS